MPTHPVSHAQTFVSNDMPKITLADRYPACRDFTAQVFAFGARRLFSALISVWLQLAQQYKDLLAQDIEIVFISAHKNEQRFKEHLAEMPWLAV